MDEPRYEYSNFKVDPQKVDDGWYLVKDGMTYRVDVPIDKMHFTKSINILTGEEYYPSNADRIRSMSDAELARFIAGQRGWYCDFKDPSEEEYPKVLSWLKEDFK